MIEAPMQGIWPPHEVFYIKGMLYNTSTALQAADAVGAALEAGAAYAPMSAEWEASAYTILDGVQTIALQAASLSRYLWPVRQKSMHLARGDQLRRSLEIGDESPLRGRELRNHLEHFDERLDEFCQTLVAGVIFPTYVGPLEGNHEIPTHLFRAYYTDVGVFEVLGKRFVMPPILQAVEDLHKRLLECANGGGRFPRTCSGA